MDTSLVSHILCKYLLPVCGLIYHNVLASLVAQKVKNLSTMQEMGRLGFDRQVRKIPWRREWLPIPVFLPEEFHGQRSLVGYSPWRCKKLDTTQRLNSNSMFSSVLEKGLLRYSCQKCPLHFLCKQSHLLQIMTVWVFFPLSNSYINIFFLTLFCDQCL